MINVNSINLSAGLILVDVDEAYKVVEAKKRNKAISNTITTGVVISDAQIDEYGRKQQMRTGKVMKMSNDVKETLKVRKDGLEVLVEGSVIVFNALAMETFDIPIYEESGEVRKEFKNTATMHINSVIAELKNE